MTQSNISWKINHFKNLDSVIFYKIAALRISIFVIEQECPYQELDGLDLDCHHIYGANETGTVVGTARILPPGTAYAYVSIGRVAVSSSYRGKGLGREIMERSISFIEEFYGKVEIKIAAQKYLEEFYKSYHFKRVSEIYLWDGIEHVDMIRPSSGK